MNKEKIFMGLDIGTNSCGWAVTNQNYEIVKKGGKSLHGVRLFDEAKTAEARRIKRSSRRRLARRRYRIDLLQELFLEEISKIDDLFFIRLNNSAYHTEDKNGSLESEFSLFNDIGFTDKEYYEKFKTIYHLRSHLINSIEKPDIRLVYLACHNIIKYRGNFLMEGIDISSSNADVLFFQDKVRELVEGLNDFIGEEKYTLAVSNKDVNKIISLISESKSNADLEKGFNEILNPENSKANKKLIKLIIGYSVSFKDLLDSEKYKDIDPKSIKFSDPSYDENVAPNLFDLVEDAADSILYAKSIYDWIIQKKLLGNHEYLSDAMVSLYDLHQKQLKHFKDYIRKNFTKETYFKMFRSTDEKANYVKYIGSNINKNIKTTFGKCKEEDFYKFVKKTLDTLSDDKKNTKEYREIIGEIDNKTFLQKIRNKNNAVIPYQIHLKELVKILKNAEAHYPSLSKKENNEKSISEKIVLLLKFRIPYYVGPLNNYHSEKFAWSVRKESGRVTPWNFEERVDIDKSAIEFIERMKNKCTYLYGKDVLPKNSLLYSEFRVLNELNKISINDELITVEDKELIINKLFKKRKKVTIKQIKELFKAEGKIEKTCDIDIKGINDADFKNSMKSYIDFTKIFGEINFDNYEKIERIIFLITIFTDKNRLEKEIRREFDLDDIVIKKIKGLTYTGWGNLSKELLIDVYKSNDLGEPISVMYLMRNENLNLQEALYDRRYNLIDLVKDINEGENLDKTISYSNLVEEAYTSPAIKRSIWQSIKVVEEVKKILGDKKIDKFFVECTREKGDKGIKKSRRKQIETLYKSAESTGVDLKKLQNELNKKDDNQLRSDKLFFYFLQLGRCAYTNEPIDLDDIFSNTYDIDHIIPRSILKDNSIKNRVLVTNKANKDKADIYPINPTIIANMKPFWKQLVDNKLMSKEKYARLTRKQELTDDEIGGFINRQLVFTNQSVKAVIEILKIVNPDSKIIYSKAGNVSDFRNKFDILKCREINDFHHAEDAYLNIVVGNVYNTKFGQDARIYIKKIKENKEGTNTKKLFDYDIKGAWDRGVSLKTVKRELSKTDILVTRMAFVGKGQFYDETIYPNTKKGLFPIYESINHPFNDVTKYGGYNSLKNAYFVLVKSNKKNKEVLTIESIPVIFAKQISNKSISLKDVLVNKLNLVNPEIILDCIKFNTLMEIGKTRFNLSGKSGNSIIVQNAIEAYANKNIKDYCRLIVKHKDINEKPDVLKAYNSDELVLSYRKNKEDLKLTKTKNVEFYQYILSQLKKSEYEYLSISKYTDRLSENLDNFKNLNVREQALNLYEMIHLIQCNASKANLSYFMEKASFLGANTISKNVNQKPIRIIDQSVTGFYERVRWSNKNAI